MRRDEVVDQVGRAWLLLGLPSEADQHAIVMDDGVILHLESTEVRDPFGTPIELSWDLASTEWRRLLETPRESIEAFGQRDTVQAPTADAQATAANVSLEITIHTDDAGQETHRSLRASCRRCGESVIAALRTHGDAAEVRDDRVETLKLAMLDHLLDHACANAAPSTR